MIVLQKEFVEGKVSDFSFEFWRIVPTNGRYYFEKQNKTKQNHGRYNKNNGIMQIYFLTRWR